MRDAMDDPRVAAAVTLVGRTGATSLQIRYSDDPDPVVWMACAEYKEGHEAAGAMHPLQAVLRLARQLMTGALCVHCSRRAGISDDWQADPPDDGTCWYVFDPELSVYRRSCAHDDRFTPIGRNDPCPCGSGGKFKNCHGGPRR